MRCSCSLEGYWFWILGELGRGERRERVRFKSSGATEAPRTHHSVFMPHRVGDVSSILKMKLARLREIKSSTKSTQLCSNPVVFISVGVFFVFVFIFYFILYWSKETSCQCRRHKRHGFDPWVREDPPEEGMTTYSGILAWILVGQRSSCTQTRSKGAWTDYSDLAGIAN